MQTNLSKGNLSNMEQTRLPNQSFRTTHQQIRVPGRYGQQFIPINSIVSNKIYGNISSVSIGNNLIRNNIHLPKQSMNNSQQESVIRNYVRPSVQTIVNQNIPYNKQKNIRQEIKNENIQNAHPHYRHEHKHLPLYNYGIEHQHTQRVSIPVYYEEPTNVRQEWERPLDGRVMEQEWKFVKTQQDKAGIIKYITREQPPVQVVDVDGRPKNALTKIPENVSRKTWCSPLIFALLGLLALIGLIVGLILLLSSNKPAAPIVKTNLSFQTAQPTPITIAQQFHPVSIPLQIQSNATTTIKTQPGIIQPIKVIPITAVNGTTKPIQTSSTTQIQKIQAVNPVYTTQTVNTINTNTVIGKNEFQVRPADVSYDGVTYVNGLQGGNAVPINAVEGSNVVTGITTPSLTTSTSSTTKTQ